MDEIARMTIRVDSNDATKAVVAQRALALETAKAEAALTKQTTASQRDATAQQSLGSAIGKTTSASAAASRAMMVAAYAQNDAHDKARALTKANDATTASYSGLSKAISGMAVPAMASIAAATAAAGSALLIASIGARRAGVEFEASLTKIATLGKGAQASMGETRAAILSTFNSVAVSGGVLDLAEANYLLQSSGRSAAEAIVDLDIAARASVAGYVDAKMAVDGLTTVTAAWKDSQISTARASDVMFAAVNVGKATFEQIAGSLGLVAPLAAAAGVRFEEVAAAAGVLSNQGVKTSSIMEGMRSAILNIQRPTEEFKKNYAALAQEFSASRLARDGIIQFLQDFNTASGGSRIALTSLFTDATALNTALGLLRNGGKDAAAALIAMDNAAGAADAALVQVNKSAKAQEQLVRNQIAGAWTQFGELLNTKTLPILENVARLINTITRGAAFVPADVANYAKTAADRVGESGAKRRELVRVADQYRASPSEFTKRLSTADLKSLRAALLADTANADAIPARLIGDIATALRDRANSTRTDARRIAAGRTDSRASAQQLAADEIATRRRASAAEGADTTNKAAHKAGEHVKTMLDALAEAGQEIVRDIDERFDVMAMYLDVYKMPALNSESLRDQLRTIAGPSNTSSAADAVARDRAPSVAAEERAEATAKKVAEQAQQVAQAFANSMQQVFANGIEDLATRGLRSFGAFFDSVKALALRTLAEIVASRAMAAMLNALSRISSGRGGGVGGAAASVGSAAGGGIFGAIGKLGGKSIAQDPFAIPGFGSKLLKGATSLPGLGVAAGGLALGNFLGSKLGSTKGAASGALAGAAAGAMIGSVVPVLGTAIGAIIGGAAGLIGGLLGGAKRKAAAKALAESATTAMDDLAIRSLAASGQSEEAERRRMVQAHKKEAEDVAKAFGKNSTVYRELMRVQAAELNKASESMEGDLPSGVYQAPSGFGIDAYRFAAGGSGKQQGATSAAPVTITGDVSFVLPDGTSDDMARDVVRRLQGMASGQGMTRWSDVVVN